MEDLLEFNELDRLEYGGRSMELLRETVLAATMRLT